jgi:hypothetical protein
MHAILQRMFLQRIKPSGSLRSLEKKNFRKLKENIV